MFQIPLEDGPNFFRLSGDRKLLVYIAHQELVCRRVEDFGLLWKRSIDARIDLNQQWNDSPSGPHVASAAYAISSDGSRVALSPWADTYHGQPERFYTELLNGGDGSAIVRLALRHRDRIALSPDGKLLLIGELVNDHSGEIRPTFHAYALPSGEEVATILHDRAAARHRLTAGVDGVDFTADGKYLITSASNSVRIWQVA